jgi:branched-chain amino acid transport system ATP-binding protein
MTMLAVSTIDGYYGDSQVLFGIDLRIGEGEVVTLLGRNGMGKSSTIKAVMGLIRTGNGDITFTGTRIDRWPSYKIARLGIALVPEGRQIFAGLTVYENLMATAANYRGVAEPYYLDDIVTIFPRLKERLRHYGNQLSGGEQQMLAIGRAMMINPRLLLLDEATEGLAPLIRQEIWRGLKILKEKSLAILVIDKNLTDLMKIADRHYIMEKGAIVWNGDSEALGADHDIQRRYLGV